MSLGLRPRHREVVQLPGWHIGMLAQIKLVAWFNRPKQQRQPPQVIVPVIGRKEKFGVPSPDCLSGAKQSLEF